jgi:hypothetical protein
VGNESGRLKVPLMKKGDLKKAFPNAKWQITLRFWFKADS